MAAKSDGKVVIEIVADDKRLSEGLNRVNERASSLSDELSRVNELLKLDPKNVQLVEQREKLLNEAISNTNEKLEILKDAQLEANEAFAQGKLSEEQYRSLQREIVHTEQELNALTEQTKKHGDTTREATKETKKLDGSIAALSLTASGAATGLSVLIGKTVAAATGYESAFAKTQTIMDTAQVEIAEMDSGIRRLSKDAAKSADTVSEAVYQAISGSVATADAVGFVDNANKLAVSGFTRLENATDILTTTLNAYHMKAEQVNGISNVLIQTQNLGKTSVDQLAANMGRAIATGSAYGVNLQNIAASYVELTRAGIATAEATTYLSGMLNELGKADSDVAKIIRQETGKSFGQLMADGYSLGDILQVLSGHVNGNAEAFMGLWGSQEAGKAANALLSMSIEDFNVVLAQMNKELDGTTGTTEKAYATMIGTSEFIDQRFTNSIDNFSIALGSQLNPALNNVKMFLTGIVEDATELISANPLFAALLTSATVGIGVLAVALAGYALKAKLATAATRELTAAISSNGILLAISAVLSLAAGIYTLIAAADDGTDSLDEMTQASQQLESTVTETETAFRTTRDEIEGTAALAEQYIGRLRELEAQQSMTASETEEYQATVDKLRTVMPDLNAEIDEQTGLLKGGADALQSQIDNWYELAVAQAMQDKVKAQIEAQAAAEVELAENMAKRQRLTNELAAAQDKQKQATAAAEKAEQQYQNQMEVFDAETEKRLAGVKTMTDAEYEALHTAYLKAQADSERYLMLANDYEMSASEIEDQLDTTNEAIAENNRVIEENAEQVEAAKDAYSYYRNEISDTADVTAGATAAWTEAATQLQEAYDKAYQSAYNSISGQIGLFQTMEPVVAESASTLIDALNSEARYMEEYTQNMQTAAARGVDTAILQALSDGSTEHAKMLAGIVNATDAQIAELNQKWTEVENGKQNFADGMAEYTGVLEDEKQVLVDLAAQAGLDMSNALTEELINGLPEYLRALQMYEPRFDLPGSHGRGISAYAAGTTSAATGFALVGEYGPELVYFHGGERVLTAEETDRALSSMYPTAPQLRATGTSVPAAARGGSVQLNAVIRVPLDIDGREFARATAKYIGEEMDFEVM